MHTEGTRGGFSAGWQLGWLVLSCLLGSACDEQRPVRGDESAASADAAAALESANTDDSQLVQDPEVGVRAGWQLIFGDEFDGMAGALPNNKRWRPVQSSVTHADLTRVFTAESDNVALNGEGQLQITALQAGDAQRFTSASLHTAGTFERVYGRFEARMQLPRGAGLWPAFILLGADIMWSGWPKCGQVDVVQHISREPQNLYAGITGEGYKLGTIFEAPADTPLEDSMHVYAVEWDEETIRWFYDDQLYLTVRKSELPSNTQWAFDHPFYLVVTLDVGGEWAGALSDATQLPKTMLVDYVRVYERAD